MSDLTFWVWCVGAAGCLAAATALALWLTADLAPKGRHRASGQSITIDLDGLRTPAYDRRPVPVPPPGELVFLPAVLPVPVVVPSVVPTRRDVESGVIARERRAVRVAEAAGVERASGCASARASGEEPEPPHVVPLWERDEERRRVRRRRALVAASKELPDPGYSFEGEHALVGVVA
ncbi:hypothetical protein SAMN05216371_1326 [Streptomyces sp. TLI_053]|uniref:hypothetical protein n=1 Tax=Streptomyces sp. TLI_053 TaxID=1855352 RepID=UPI00087A0E7F|nr:hypothetical protein [Streptomyces sp. TLI_053]SDT11742.1 hypothetical protein SAMN05216371_1326 [Streptomyces sp. TLI_053]